MRCFVPSCDHDTNNTSCIDTTFFTFPMEPSLRAAWVEVLREAGLQPHEDSVICSDHFRAESLLKCDGGLQKLRADTVPVVDLQVCRICFSTKSKLRAITACKNLYEAYDSLMGLSIETIVNSPPYLCPECADQVLDCARFRIKTLRAHSILLELHQHDHVTVESIKSINELSNPLDKLDFTYDESDQCELNIKLMEKYNNITKLGVALEGIKMDFDELVTEESTCVDLVRAQLEIPGGHIQSENNEKDTVIEDSVSNVGAIVEDKTESGKEIVQYVRREADASEEVGAVAMQLTNYLNNETMSGVVETESSEEIEHNIVGKQGYAASITIYKSPKGTYRCRMNNKNHEMEHDVDEENIANNVSASAISLSCEKTTGSEDQTSNGEAIEQNIVKKENAGNIDSISISNSAEGTASFRVESENMEHAEHSVRREKGVDDSDSIAPCSLDEEITNNGIRNEDSEEIKIYVTLKKNDWNVGFLKKCSSTTDLVTTNDGDVYQDRIRKASTNGEVESRIAFLGEASSIDATALTGGGSQTAAGRSSAEHSTDTKEETEPISDASELLITGKLTCDICPYKTASQVQLLAHLKAHAAVKSYDCKVCSYKTVQNTSLRVHMLIHTDKKPHVCEVCNKSFRREGHLKMHSLIHSGDKSYICDRCESAFSRRQDLQAHLLTHSRQYVYICKVCKKSFTRKFYLERHVRAHLGERPHPCEICKKSFVRKDDLQNHLLTHSGDKPYSCDVCGKSYSHKRNLQDHVVLHDKEKPFPCSLCNMKFRHQHNLKFHLLRHSGEKPHACTICKKSFIRKDALRAHLFTHSADKPYSCNICNKSFGIKYHLKKHMRIHTDKAFSCSICSKVYRRSSSLQNHLKSHSNTKSVPFSNITIKEIIIL